PRQQYDLRTPAARRQSISGSPRSRKMRLIVENGLLPKKPPWADRGEGCGASRSAWRGWSLSFFFFCACPRHRTTMDGSGCALRPAMMESVKVAHPLLLWLLGVWAQTVSTVLSSKTPCLPQGTRQPLVGSGTPRSACSSLKMLTSDGGGFNPGGTENAS